MEARAERCLRRGEMSEALSLYRQLVAELPGDAALKAKLAHLEESVDPRELHSGALPPTEAKHAPATTPEQEGERLFALGDFAGAAAAYRRALNEKPDSELIKERLIELFRLAQTAPRHSPTDSALPEDPESKLRALLDRISARKKIVLQ